MRIQSKPTTEQCRDLQAALANLQQPDVAREIVCSRLQPPFEPQSVLCRVQSVHPDRFVMQVLARSAGGDEVSYAWKVYSDGFGEQMWKLAQVMAERFPSNHNGLCLPSHYLAGHHVLVFPWLEGPRLSDVVDDRKPGLLQRAAKLAAAVHRTPVAGMPHLTTAMVVIEALDRCDRLRCRWPSLEPTVKELVALMEAAAGRLDATRPAVIHGDLAAGQFLCPDDRLVLLDLDTAACGDPAYDVGHFLGQLERRCLLDPSLPAHAQGWLASFREAYAAEALGVSWRNVSFYQGITLVRKMYTLSQRDPVAGARLAAPLAEPARAALEVAMQAAGGGTRRPSSRRGRRGT